MYGQGVQIKCFLRRTATEETITGKALFCQEVSRLWPGSVVFFMQGFFLNFFQQVPTVLKQLTITTGATATSNGNRQRISSGF
jgi:hypothetical protein